VLFRSISLQAWSMTYTSAKASNLVDEWGTPYWNFNDWINNVNNGAWYQTGRYANLGSLIPVTSKQFNSTAIYNACKAANGFMQLHFESGASASPASLVWNCSFSVGTQEVFRFKTSISAPWGCDLTEFILGVDGNLILMPYQSAYNLARLTSVKCLQRGPFFQSYSYNYVAGLCNGQPCPNALQTASPATQYTAMPIQQPPTSTPVTLTPSSTPTKQPSTKPSVQPSSKPSTQPSVQPTLTPVKSSSALGTKSTVSPSRSPSKRPLKVPK